MDERKTTYEYIVLEGYIMKHDEKGSYFWLSCRDVEKEFILNEKQKCELAYMKEHITQLYVELAEKGKLLDYLKNYSKEASSGEDIITRQYMVRFPDMNETTARGFARECVAYDRIS